MKALQGYVKLTLGLGKESVVGVGGPSVSANEHSHVRVRWAWAFESEIQEFDDHQSP